MRREFAALAVSLAAMSAFAQTTAADSEVEWQEAEVPPPPALRKDSLVPIEVTGAVELRYAVDPQSVAIGPDGVVRYVVVATSRSGALNAIYEGVRCDRAEYRVYARYGNDGWRMAHTEWRSLYDGVEARHARAIARGGACFGPAPNKSPKQIVQDLRTPDDRKFGGSGAP